MERLLPKGLRRRHPPPSPSRPGPRFTPGSPASSSRRARVPQSLLAPAARAPALRPRPPRPRLPPSSGPPQAGSTSPKEAPPRAGPPPRSPPPAPGPLPAAPPALRRWLCPPPRPALRRGGAQGQRGGPCRLPLTCAAAAACGPAQSGAERPQLQHHPGAILSPASEVTLGGGQRAGPPAAGPPLERGRPAAPPRCPPPKLPAPVSLPVFPRDRLSSSHLPEPASAQRPPATTLIPDNELWRRAGSLFLFLFFFFFFSQFFFFS